MIPANVLAKNAGRIVSKNSPTILTALGAAGLVSTAVLTGKAAHSAALILQDRDKETRLEGFDKREQFIDDAKTVWKLYIPAASVGAVSLACIFGANNVSSKRNAALISAYSLTETAFVEYKDKVVEQMGAGKEQKLRDEIAQDQVRKNPAMQEKIIVTGKGDTLCYESYTGRYFYCDVETIRQAQNTINDEILHNNCASLNEFNDLLGLQPTQIGEEMGWTADRLLKVQFSSILDEASNPCLSIGYELTPVRDFYKLR